MTSNPDYDALARSAGWTPSILKGYEGMWYNRRAVTEAADRGEDLIGPRPFVTYSGSAEEVCRIEGLVPRGGNTTGVMSPQDIAVARSIVVAQSVLLTTPRA